MKIVVQRNGQIFGPYPLAIAQQYLAQGSLLPQDLAREDGNLTAQWQPLSRFLAQAGISVLPKGGGNTLSAAMQNLKSFDARLLFPWNEISSLRWLRDRRLMYLAAIGLTPVAALVIAPGVWLGYWAIAFYFSSLWALFLYYLFKTHQVQTKLCLVCYFFTGIISTALLMVLQQIPPWSILYLMAGSDTFPIRFIGMFFGVGIHEELCKAAILFWLVSRPGNLLIPQTVVFYGMMAGLGFGIYEGVAYQQTFNRAQGVDIAYFLDIARLTSLPFLHAIWTGIAGYFISFAGLVPAKRYGLWILAIVIPASIHAIYDTLGLGFIALGIALTSVILLMSYLSNCSQIQKNLTSP
jgi:RsiW-degrading membrane proteinase PrsW (M82 family)